jgi:hypothetical protein
MLRIVLIKWQQQCDGMIWVASTLATIIQWNNSEMKEHDETYIVETWLHKTNMINDEQMKKHKIND